MLCMVGIGIAVAQAGPCWAQTSGEPAQVAGDLASLRASFGALNTIMVELAEAVTPLQRQQLLTEGNRVLSSDTSLLDGLGQVCVGAGTVVPQVAPPPATGFAPTPEGTPVPPAMGTPFPFSGGTAPMP